MAEIPTVSLVKGESHIRVNETDVPSYKKLGYKTESDMKASDEKAPSVDLTGSEPIDLTAPKPKRPGRPKK